jgi:hypothetical protein
MVPYMKPSEKITKMIQKLKKDNELLKKGEIDSNEIIERNKELHDKYPTIATKVKEETLEIKHIQFMLNALDAMEEGNMSEHDASVCVGTHLRDEFVLPQLNIKKEDLDKHLKK